MPDFLSKMQIHASQRAFYHDIFILYTLNCIIIHFMYGETLYARQPTGAKRNYVFMLFLFTA